MENYQVIKQIGKGSYGSVFLVKSKKDNRQYVLKRIPLQDMSPKERKAAKLEVSLLQQFRHPNIVAYIDSFLDLKDLCIVMTYCDGGDLATKISAQKGKRIPENLILKWFVQICGAISFIHARKVLHRDLKTQNIFLMKNGTVKLGDFGIARVLNQTMDMARTAIGTPLYMSPETVGNQPYSFKSDIWSLGCVVYEMASFRHPFNANDMRALFVKIMRGVYSPIPFQYSASLRNLIDRMLSVSPNKRPSVDLILAQKFLLKPLNSYISTNFGPHFFPSHFNSEQKSHFQSELTQIEQEEISNLKEQLINNLQISLDFEDESSPSNSNPVSNTPSNSNPNEEKEKEKLAAIKQLQKVEEEKKRIKTALEKLKLERIERQKKLDQIKKQRLDPPPIQIPVSKKPQNLETSPSEYDDEEEDDDFQKEKKIAKEREELEEIVANLQQKISKIPQISKKDQILLEKNKKKEELERKRMMEIKEAMNVAAVGRAEAKKKEIQMYRPNPSNPIPYCSNSNLNVGRKEQVEVLDEEDQIAIEEMQKVLKETKKQISEMKSSINLNFGVQNYKELKQDSKTEEDDVFFDGSNSNLNDENDEIEPCVVEASDDEEEEGNDLESGKLGDITTKLKAWKRSTDNSNGTELSSEEEKGLRLLMGPKFSKEACENFKTLIFAEENMTD